MFAVQQEVSICSKIKKTLKFWNMFARWKMIGNAVLQYIVVFKVYINKIWIFLFSGTFAHGITDRARFVWIEQIKNCIKFSYYGAKGNYNNFPTFHDCILLFNLIYKLNISSFCIGINFCKKNWGTTYSNSCNLCKSTLL